MADHNSYSTHLERRSLPAEWDHALGALQGHQKAGLGWVPTGKYNPQPLAELLLSGKTVPEEVIKVIGRLLSPPKGYIGGRLKYHPSGRQARELIGRKNRDQKAYTLLRKLIDEGNTFQKAVYHVAKEFKMSESAVSKLKDISDDEWFEEISNRLDSGTLLP